MRTPGHEDELAVGFLRTEGLIEGTEVVGTEPGDPVTLSQPDDTIVVRLSQPFDDSAVAERHFVATASCGICGKASIDEVAMRCDVLPDGPVVARSVILALPDLLRAAQRAFDETGGLHAAALFSPAGELIAIREDVGRHNALDKLIGSQVLAGELPLHQRLLMVSGRVSFEIVQKAAVAGIPIIAAVSAPSDLAVETAERLDVTLIGFLRADGFNVYSHDRRVDLKDLTGWT
jgi:FdhD protein